MFRVVAFPVVALAIASASVSSANEPDAVPAKPPIYFDFKGARLGMSLAEWRALPVPVRSDSDKYLRYGPVQIVCSTDAAASAKFGLTFERTGAEQAANVVECAYGRQVLSMMFKPWMRVPIGIGTRFAASDITYKFLDGRLFAIELFAHTNLLPDILSGLIAKWGEPNSVLNDTTQNKAGATFPHTLQEWANPVSTIKLESPYGRIDQLNVTYETVEGAAKIAAVEKAINPDAEKM